MEEEKSKVFPAELNWTKKKKKGKKVVIFKKKKSVFEKDEDEAKRLVGNYKNINPESIKTFKDFPLSRKTLEGLQLSSYITPTDVQREAIGLALKSHDILGAAQTGCGKTLAFLIPLIELLFTKLWTKDDGLGALIITPTRELAYQIFETLKKVGRKHEFSAGLVIGGKDLKFEKKRMNQVNIMICTPGRLLQHMDENPYFDCSNLQILVLDEADRCLDLGFEQTMNGIIANLPKERQTLLFSATQTKSVRDLARLSLKCPVYVSIHENSKFSTPKNLEQSYVICPLESKIDMLWSFIKHHRKSKILVFMASCKQVRFINMLFCRMRPGISLLALYGTLHQLKRMSVYEEFCKKQAVVLFATDIAARGLDFPEVDWVVQLDCPEDATTYIHRVGRTGRYNKNGQALLVLLPSESNSMLEELNDKKIPIEQIELNPNKQMSVGRKFESLLARDGNLKEMAQRAFKAYLKSCFLMKNKKVFDISTYDLPSFARSLGLAVAPRVRFLQKRLKESSKSEKNKNVKSQIKGKDDEDESCSDDEKVVRDLTKSSNVTFDFGVGDDDDVDGVDDLFIGKKSSQEVSLSDSPLISQIDSTESSSKKSKKSKTKASIAKKLLKKNLRVNEKVVFDDEGERVRDERKERQSEEAKKYEGEDASGVDIERAKEILKLEDKYDRQMFRERIREKHRAQRDKLKLKRKGDKKEKDEEEEMYCIRNSDDESDEDANNGEETNFNNISQSENDDEEDEDEETNFKNISQNDEDDENEESDTDLQNKNSEEDEDDEPPPRKISKLKKSKIINKTSKLGKSRGINPDAIDKDIMEEFALKLLHSSK